MIETENYQPLEIDKYFKEEREIMFLMWLTVLKEEKLN